jgi:sugar/nucleoside kinase (ribokinase family)
LNNEFYQIVSMQPVILNKLKISCFSAICVDYFPQTGILRPGGNSLNFAVHAKRQGAGKVSIAGFIGTDTHAKMLLELFDREQIDFKYLSQLDGATASNKIYNTPDGERYSNEGDWQNGVKDSGHFTDEIWKYLLEHDVIAVPYLDKNLDKLLKRRTSRQFITVDFLHFDNAEIIRPYMGRVDIAFTSPSMEHVTKLKNLTDSSQTLLVTMLGAHGSKVFQGGKEFVQPAFKIKKVTDTTGCGDSYQAAFVCSYFVDRDIPKAMLKGTETASEVLTHPGAV